MLTFAFGLCLFLAAVGGVLVILARQNARPSWQEVSLEEFYQLVKEAPPAPPTPPPPPVISRPLRGRSRRSKAAASSKAAANPVSRGGAAAVAVRDPKLFTLPVSTVDGGGE